MRHASGEILALGIGVALSPAAIITVILMLAAREGRASALAFVAGWMVSLGVLGTIVLLVADGADARRNDSPADWVVALQIVLGGLLLVVAVRQWRSRTEAESEPAAWMQKVDTLTPLRAIGLAVLLASVKPKNLILTVSAAIAIAETGVSGSAQAGALAVFVLLGTLGPGIPLAISLFMRERAAVVLGGVRDWMVRENATIIAVLCVVFSAKLLGDAIS